MNKTDYNHEKKNQIFFFNNDIRFTNKNFFA